MSLPPPSYHLQASGRNQMQRMGRRTDESVVLTRREIDVLRLIATGMTDRQIAATLCVSRKTASNHVSSILHKIGAATRASAASYAVRSGLA